MIPINYYLIIAGAIFSIGAIGVLVRRSAIVIFMCIEMMLAAANFTLIIFARYLHSMDGQVFSLIVMAVGAAEAAVGLAILMELFRRRATTDVDEINLLKW